MMNRRQFIKQLLATTALAAIPAEVLATIPEQVPVGFTVQVEKWKLTLAGEGLIPCDGRSLSRLDYPELFAMLDVKHGSCAKSGPSNTLSVPNLVETK